MPKIKIKNGFEVGLIEGSTLSFYEPMLTEEVVSGIRTGAPYIILGAQRDGKAIGALAGAPADSDLFKIESLFVIPEAREMGAGSALVDSLLEELASIDPMMAVSADFAGYDDDADAESLVSFFTGRGLCESDEIKDGEHHFVFFAD